MRSIYIINGVSNSLNYGIGTYMKSLLVALKEISVKVNIVELYSKDVSDFCVQEIDGINYFKIPLNKIDYSKNPINKERYQRNAFYCLYPYLSVEKHILCHFNYLRLTKLAQLIKENFNCKIITAVHFSNWNFRLFGDINKMKTLVDTGFKDDLSVKISFDEEEMMMNKYSDYVIAIAKHSVSALSSLYQVPVEKIHLIPHGIKDQYKKKNKQSIKEKYHLKEKEKLIIFAGRLDEAKGLYFLLSAFKEMVKKRKKIRLIIVGDGNISEYVQFASQFGAKVTFTGYLQQEELFELYSVASVGVVPSFHEEFGYVAIEMMMNNLPILVNKTTGLTEITEDGLEESRFQIDATDNFSSGCIAAFCDKMLGLLNDTAKRKEWAVKGRKKYIQHYSQESFNNRMKVFYEQVVCK